MSRTLYDSMESLTLHEAMVALKAAKGFDNQWSAGQNALRAYERENGPLDQEAENAARELEKVGA